MSLSINGSKVTVWSVTQSVCLTLEEAKHSEISTDERYCLQLPPLQFSKLHLQNCAL